MKDDTYKCANRKCKHIYKHQESVYVRENPDGFPPVLRGTCPKCGCKSFYIHERAK